MPSRRGFGFKLREASLRREKELNPRRTLRWGRGSSDTGTGVLFKIGYEDRESLGIDSGVSPEMKGAFLVDPWKEWGDSVARKVTEQVTAPVPKSWIALGVGKLYQERGCVGLRLKRPM